MKRLLIAGASLLSLTSLSTAADMPAYPQTEAAVVAYNWSGFYVGVHGGWGWGQSDIASGAEFEPEGFVVGGQAGYNWQWDSIVLGIEADGSYSDQEETLGGTDTVETDYLASVRGRLGFAADRFLVYGTGGVAFAGLTFDDSVGDDEASYFGWAAGAGVEYAFSDMVSFGVEYLHYEFDEEEFDTPLFPPDEADFSNDVVRGRLNVKFDGLSN